MSSDLRQGDCLEVMKTLPDKSIDCFICDLPYGQLHNPKLPGGDAERFPDERCAWDVKIDLAAFWTQVKRLAKDKHTPVIMFCNTKFGFDLYNSNPSWFRYDLVWDKGLGVSFLLANKQPMKSHEMIYVFSKAGSYYKRVDEVKDGKTDWTRDRSKDPKPKQYDIKQRNNTSGGEGGKRCVLSVIYQSNSTKKRDSHPTEKPRELYKWLLERYCPAGGTVLDPTAGSFNSVAVAKEMGLKAIGIEKDEDFFKKAQAKFSSSGLPTETPRNEVVFEAAPAKENVAPEENEVD